MIFNPQKAFRKQPMVYIAIAFIVGVLLNKFLNGLIFPSAVPIIFIIILIFMSRWKYFDLLFIILIIALGFSISIHKNQNFSESLNGIKQFSDKQVEFSGIIIEENNYSSGQRFVIENINLKSKDLSYTKNFKYLLYPKDQIIDNMYIGDTLRGFGKWQLFNEIQNPGEYDYKRFSLNKKITGKIYSKSEIQVFSNLKWSYSKSIADFREKVRTKLTAYSDDETSALLSALILGDRTHIDRDLRESFANVGVIHVLAVSGLHVGYVLIILLLIVKIIRIPWGWDKLFIIFGLILFTMLSGGRPSVVRASIMASLYIFAPALNRRPNALNVIATAAVIILLINPNSLYDLGFQLSFVAVISIVYFYNLINKLLPGRLKVSNVQNNVARFFWALLLISFSAQIGTIPIVAYYFGRISLIAILANIIVIPLIGGFVALGFAKLFFFWIAPLNFFFDQAIWLIKELIYGSISIFDKFPFASLSAPQFNWINLIQYILIVVWFFAIIQRKYNNIIISGLLFINLILWTSVFDKKGMDIIFIDLGTNESTIIKNNDNKSILINAGILNQFSDDLNRKILPVIKHLNLKNINWLIKSKGNSNHQIAVAKTIETIPIDTVWGVGLNSDSWIYEYIRNMVELKNIDYNVIQRGDTIRIDNQSYIQFLLPINKYQAEDSHFAMKIVNGSNSILFIDKLNEREFKILINDGRALKSDVLKMTYPKHIQQNFIEFIQTVNAKMTIITGMKSSKYSHTPKELNKIFDSELFFTDSIGAVWLFSDGKNPIEVKEWK